MSPHLHLSIADTVFIYLCAFSAVAREDADSSHGKMVLVLAIQALWMHPPCCVAQCVNYLLQLTSAAAKGLLRGLP